MLWRLALLRRCMTEICHKMEFAIEFIKVVLDRQPSIFQVNIKINNRPRTPPNRFIFFRDLSQKQAIPLYRFTLSFSFISTLNSLKLGLAPNPARRNSNHSTISARNTKLMLGSLQTQRSRQLRRRGLREQRLCGVRLYFL